jgi:hypothetical protein
MKKFVVLAGLAACAYGAVKFLRGNANDEFAQDDYRPSEYRADATYPASPYTTDTHDQAAA